MGAGGVGIFALALFVVTFRNLGGREMAPKVLGYARPETSAFPLGLFRALYLGRYVRSVNWVKTVYCQSAVSGCRRLEPC